MTMPPEGAPLCFLDTETTELDRDRRRVWEVSMIRRHIDGAEDALSLYVDDVDLSEASPASLRIGRFYERHPRFATGRGDSERARLVSEAQTAKYVEQWTRGAWLVGAVPSFDEDCLYRMVRRHQLAESWHHRLVCIESVMAGALRQKAPWHPKEMSARLGVDPGRYELHTAHGDAEWTRDVWDVVMEEKPRPRSSPIPAW